MERYNYIQTNLPGLEGAWIIQSDPILIKENCFKPKKKIMRKRPKVLVQIKGGNLDFVAVNDPNIDVIVVDFDNYVSEEDCRGLAGVTNNDLVTNDFPGIYNKEDGTTQDKLVYKLLKEEGL